MNDESMTFRNDSIDDLYDASHRISNNGLLGRHTRQAFSHVDFRVDPDVIGRILPPAEKENSRRKHRVKCQHCASCHCQQTRENNYSVLEAGRKSENFERKNSVKPEAVLSQRLEYENSKNGNFSMRSHRVRSSPQQRSQAHRPGTSTSHCQNRNIPLNSGAHRSSTKYENSSRRECPRRDSPIREIVNSDGATEETDYRLFCEHRSRSRNACKDADRCWQCTSGEAHSEPEIDSPLKCSEPEKRRSGKGDNASENPDEREHDGKPLIETGSSVAKDDWRQYERDQRELKDLGEDLRAFVKHKASTGQIHEEKKKERQDCSNDTLEKIDLFVSSLPVPRPKNSTDKTRIQASKIDPRRTSSREERKDEERRRKLKEELLHMQLESCKLKEEIEDGETEEEEEEESRNNGKEEQAGSETEEEARQLLNVKKDSERSERELEGSWGKRKSRRKIEREKRNSRGREKSRGGNVDREEKPEICREASATATFSGEPKSQPEAREPPKFRKKRANAREENSERERMYERANNVLDEPRENVEPAARDSGDIEREIGKARACIDEMIDVGLCREANRHNFPTFPARAKKDFHPEDEDETRRVFRRRHEKIEAPKKIVCHECFCQTLARRRELLSLESIVNNELEKIPRHECFCQRMAKILAENLTSPRDYVRKLKNRRWHYLDNIQSVLAKLYDLERFLDSCSPDRSGSFIKSRIEPNPTNETEGNIEKGLKDRYDDES